jgi:hypothetical protein
MNETSTRVYLTRSPYGAGGVHATVFVGAHARKLGSRTTRRVYRMRRAWGNVLVRGPRAIVPARSLGDVLARPCGIPCDCPHCGQCLKNDCPCWWLPEADA